MAIKGCVPVFFNKMNMSVIVVYLSVRPLFFY